MEFQFNEILWDSGMAPWCGGDVWYGYESRAGVSHYYVYEECELGSNEAKVDEWRSGHWRDCHRTILNSGFSYYVENNYETQVPEGYDYI